MRTDCDQRFYREIIGWKYVSHPNIVPFLGVSETVFPFCVVSPWLSNGNILEYIKKNRRVDRLQLVSDPPRSPQPAHLKRARQLAQAAFGLEYLHSLSMVHSDINPVSTQRILGLKHVSMFFLPREIS